MNRNRNRVKFDLINHITKQQDIINQSLENK